MFIVSKMTSGGTGGRKTRRYFERYRVRKGRRWAAFAGAKTKARRFKTRAAAQMVARKHGGRVSMDGSSSGSSRRRTSSKTGTRRRKMSRTGSGSVVGVGGLF